MPKLTSVVYWLRELHVGSVSLSSAINYVQANICSHHNLLCKVMVNNLGERVAAQTLAVICFYKNKIRKKDEEQQHSKEFNALWWIKNLIQCQAVNTTLGRTSACALWSDTCMSHLGAPVWDAGQAVSNRLTTSCHRASAAAVRLGMPVWMRTAIIATIAQQKCPQQSTFSTRNGPWFAGCQCEPKGRGVSSIRRWSFEDVRWLPFF